MPKVFGLRLRDIICPPTKLKLDADPIKLPSSPSTNAHGSQLKIRRTTSYKSTKRLSRVAKLLKTTTSSPNIDRSEEQKRLVGDTNLTDDSQAEQAEGRHRTTGHRKRKALSGLGFGRQPSNKTDN